MTVECVGRSKLSATGNFQEPEVPLGVQLARSLEANFEVKRCRINGKCES
jgi:hypothetical protein